jgi:hypothetical protein
VAALALTLLDAELEVVEMYLPDRIPSRFENVFVNKSTP